MSLLYLDIETAVQDEKITEEDLRALLPKTIKLEESIKKKLDENKEALTREIIKKRSLDPYQCKIICISYSFNGEKPQAIIGSESKILSILQTKVQDHLKEYGGSITGISLVGHNIKNFDAPIIYLRACRYNLDSLKQLFYFTRSNIIDTMTLGSYFVYGKMPSLEKLCLFFDIPTPKDEMDGSMVYDYYKQGKIEEISLYCNKDVETLINIYQKLMV